MNNYQLTVSTAKGTFHIEATDNGLTALHFPGTSRMPQKKEPVPAPAFMRQTADFIRQYWEGTYTDFSLLPIDWDRIHRSFELAVLKKLFEIPYGVRATYGQLAEMAGLRGAARAVGGVMSRNQLPLILPCHRILPFNGKVGNYGPGPKWKEEMLRMEAAGMLALGSPRQNVII